MAVELFQAKVRQEQGAAVIELFGEINGGSEAQLTEAYELARQTDPPVIILNFARVGYINSTGIALIVSILARARRDDIALITCELSDHYLQIFEITRLVDFMEVAPDEETALSSLTNDSS